jgi:hypothetical protein
MNSLGCRGARQTIGKCIHLVSAGVLMPSAKIERQRVYGDAHDRAVGVGGVWIGSATALA